MKNNERILLYSFAFLVFSFFFVFFFYLHPISVSDTDDWKSLVFHRDAWPIWGAWNPIRVFAEVTIPIVSYVSGALFYPVIGNIFVALSLGYAICISTAVTGLTLVLCKAFRKKHSMPAAVAVSLFFLICHFWIFREEYQGNDYMLRTVDACTVFYYVIPNLLNAILVLWMETDRGLLGGCPAENRIFKTSVFIVLTYFCIFSNIWSGMILAAYIGGTLLFSLMPLLQRQKSPKEWLSENRILLILLAVWALSQIFEMNGRRADDIGNSLADELGKTFAVMFQTAHRVNHRYLAVMCILMLAGILVQITGKKKSELKTTAFWGTCLLLASVYMILTCAKAGHSKAARPDVFYGLFFFGFLMIAVNATELARRFPKIKIWIPLLLILMLNDCFSGGRTFRESNVLNLSPKIVNNVNNDIVDQLKAAEDAGQDTVVLEVPDFGREDNWPYAVYAADAFGESMWKLHVTEQRILVEDLLPSSEKNALLSVGTRGSS